MDFRQILKNFAYCSGIAGLYHHVRNRRQLTTVMFHRVLPENDPRWATADPEWTVSEQLFEQCLQFFVKHYQVISFEQLLAAREDASLLPDRPLLITFDDGWADNAEYALRALKKYGLPALVFVVAGAVDRQEPWDEKLRYAERRDSIRMAQWRELSNTLDLPTNSLEELISRLAPMEAAQREQIVDNLVASSQQQPAMLSTQQLKELIAGGVTIGSHGMTHTPVPRACTPETEIAGSRRALTEMLKDEQRQQQVLSISFPHGIYDEATITHAQQAGYKFLFTSAPFLTPLEHGNPLARVLGRIHISGPNLAGPQNNLNEPLLAFWLFDRKPATVCDAVDSVIGQGAVA